jgi:hypothetical protein
LSSVPKIKIADYFESGLIRDIITASLAKNIIKNAVETLYYIQAVSKILVLVALALSIPNIFLSGD